MKYFKVIWNLKEIIFLFQLLKQFVTTRTLLHVITPILFWKNVYRITEIKSYLAHKM